VPRLHLGSGVEADPVARDLHPHARHPLLPRLLQPRTLPGLDASTVRGIAKRLAALRVVAGRLTGQAADEDLEPEPVVDLLSDVRDVMNHPRVPTMHLAELVDTLAAVRPQTWGHINPTALGSLLPAVGVRAGTVWSRAAGKDGKGIKAEWLSTIASDDGGDVVVLTERRGT